MKHYFLCWVLVVCYGLGWQTPPAWATETVGWHDIYLTYNRICKQCHMTDNQDGTVYMANQQGIGANYPAHEVLGVDYHPLQRKFRRHLATTLNPAAAKTLMPYSLEAPVHQDWRDETPQFYEKADRWWR